MPDLEHVFTRTYYHNTLTYYNDYMLHFLKMAHAYTRAHTHTHVFQVLYMRDQYPSRWESGSVSQEIRDLGALANSVTDQENVNLAELPCVVLCSKHQY